MDLPPSNLTTIRRLRDGRTVQIEKDVHGVADDLQRIDPSLHLRYSESAEVFVVYERRCTNAASNEFEDHLVTTSPYCDQRLVKRVQRISSPSYDYVRELERIDAEADKAKAERFSEQVREIGEQLAYAARKDLGVRKHH